MASIILTIIISVTIFGIIIFLLVKKILKKRLNDFAKNTEIRKKN